MKHSFMTGVILLLLLARLSQAQTLDSLVREALTNYPGLRSFDYQIQAAEFRARSVQALPPPTIGLEFTQIPTNTLNPLNGATSNNLLLSQMFMLGGKLSAMGNVEKKKAKVLEQDRGSLIVQLRAKVKMAYFQLWLLDRQIEVRQTALGLLEDLAQSMLPQVLTNKLRQADLLTLQADVAAEKSRLTSLHSKRLSLQNEMFALLARDDRSSAILTDSVLTAGVIPPSEFQLAERVRRGNPVLAGMDQMKEVNESEMIAAKKDLVPDLMLQAMIMRMPNGMVLTGGQRSAYAIQQSSAGMPMQSTEWMYSLMVSFTLPFAPWSSGRSAGKAEEFRAMNLSIDAQRNSMQREMLAQLRSSILKYVTADSLAKQYSLTVLPLMREAAEAQTVAYQTGRVPISIVLDARRMELMKRDEYLMILVDRQMALTEMEMMVGEPLNEYL